MALVTIGTNAPTTLSGIQWTPTISPANVAAINNAIKTQGTAGRLVGGFENNGLLYVPNRRGPILLANGDWIIIGSTGMPFVMSNKGVVADFTHG